MSKRAGDDIRTLIASINSRWPDDASRAIDPGIKAEKCDARGATDNAVSNGESSPTARWGSTDSFHFQFVLAKVPCHAKTQTEIAYVGRSACEVKLAKPVFQRHHDAGYRLIHDNAIDSGYDHPKTCGSMERCTI